MHLKSISLVTLTEATVSDDLLCELYFKHNYVSLKEGKSNSNCMTHVVANVVM
jgi:hypothetical protein